MEAVAIDVNRLFIKKVYRWQMVNDWTVGVVKMASSHPTDVARRHRKNQSILGSQEEELLFCRNLDTRRRKYCWQHSSMSNLINEPNQLLCSALFSCPRVTESLCVCVRACMSQRRLQFPSHSSNSMGRRRSGSHPTPTPLTGYMAQDKV